MSTTSSVQAWLTGTDWNLASVLAAKWLVRDAQAEGAAQNKKAAEATRKRIGACSKCPIHASVAPAALLWCLEDKNTVQELVTFCTWSKVTGLSP